MRTKRDLEQLLNEHLDWLRASAERYDARHFSEAKRIAVIIRSLVHDTGVSTSLLSQLGMRDKMVWRSAVGFEDATFVSPPWADLPHEPGFTDIRRMSAHEIDFDTWWKAPMLTHDGTRIDRSWFVLHAANFDGGAHVDPQLPETYRSLTREGGLNPLRINSVGEQYPDCSDPVPSALRTICTEVAVSIDGAQM